MNKVFGETWVRTDQSIAAYRASLPVCSQETSMDSLRSKVAALTDACTALLQEETLAIEEGEREQMLSFLDQIADVSEYERLNELYESLHTLYQTVYTRTHS